MITKFLRCMNSLKRRNKGILITLADMIIVLIALYSAYALRYGQLFPIEHLKRSALLFPAMLLAVICYNWVLKIPKIKLQAFDLQAIQRLAICSFLLILTAMSLSFLFRLPAPRSVPATFGLLCFSGTLLARINILLALKKLIHLGNQRTPVVIYGAGEAGIQLASSLQQSKEVKPVAFIDDNKLNQRIMIFGLPVHGPHELEKLVKQNRVAKILIAIPSLPKTDRQALAAKLAPLPCDIQIMPSNIDIIHGQKFLESLVQVKPEELLGREKFDSELSDIGLPYESHNILVSGAGGSIGSELCRQILQYQPRKIVLFEQSEFALYSVERELKPIAEKMGIELVAILGSVCDTKIVKYVFETHKIEVVFHAAAYKHVPLVEKNEIAGINNNVIGTHTIAHQALKSKIKTFILVSTDKAVKPTNVMGATKRLAELVIQEFDSRNTITKFSMVRFGNVLGSSGSVIPLFREQIAKGGPVTLTHEEITRYFMAISEAAYLVVVAGSFSKGGEVFVLDMGSPVKIKDLAHRMIEKSGYTVRNSDNLNGDIEIITTGLRPGEKLYEELLIDAETLKTPHPKILRAKEKSLNQKDVKRVIKDITLAITNNDEQRAREIIAATVEGYSPPP